MDPGKKKLPKAGGKKLLFIKPETYEALRAAAETGGVVPDPTQFDTVERAGKKHFRLKAQREDGSGPRGGGGRWTITTGEESRIYVGMGIVNYVRVVNIDPEEPEEQTKKQFIVGKVPTIDGVSIEAEDPPFFDASGMTSGIVWLIVQAHQCNASVLADDPERLELTAAGEKPDIANSEVAVKIADFDLVTEGDAMRLENLRYRLRSDWEQPYLCDGNFDPSDDEDLGSDEDSGQNGSSGGGGGPPGSGEEDPDAPEGCKVKMTVRWLNRVDCFPSQPLAAFPCTPGKFVFELQVTFSGEDPFDRDCPGWAYGVTMVGSTTPEQVWLNVRSKRLRFEFDSAPACARATVRWRARGFGPLRGPDNEIIESCCGVLYSGAITTRQLPPVCGCGCSSSGDLDGDGIPNEEDDDIDGDGWGNAVDGDVDGDGILDEDDPDIDGDGIPNESDPSPEGP